MKGHEMHAFRGIVLLNRPAAMHAEAETATRGWVEQLQLRDEGRGGGGSAKQRQLARQANALPLREQVKALPQLGTRQGRMMPFTEHEDPHALRRGQK